MNVFFHYVEYFQNQPFRLISNNTLFFFPEAEKKNEQMETTWCPGWLSKLLIPPKQNNGDTK